MDTLEKAIEELTSKLDVLKDNKIEKLEKVVQALVRKTLTLENEIKELKKTSSSKHIKEKEDITDKVYLTENYFASKVSFNNDEINEKCSTPKKIKCNEKEKEGHSEEEMLTCNKCKYTCKKETTLKNHILTKHKEHQCKECKEKLPTFMQLLAQITKNHFKEESEVQVEESKDDEIMKNRDDKAENNVGSSLNLSDSMLDEFIEKKK